MTPEQKAKQLMVEIGPMFDFDAPWETRVERGYSAPTNDAVELIAQAIGEAKAEAYEEAARKMCWYCERGKAVEPSDVEGIYMHPKVEPRQLSTLDMQCDASAIHALKDSLVQELVSP